MPTAASLPDYEPMLAAYHRAFAPELREIIAGLPIREGDKVVEIACGDGAYSPWLAGRVGPDGVILAIDIAPAYLRVARASPRAPPSRHAWPTSRRRSSGSPCPRGAFDLAWCAQSLYSLPDQLEAIRAMADLVRPGGTVAVLENDTLHQLVLPWPVDLELAVRRCRAGCVRREDGPPGRYYIGRRLVELFSDAGLDQIHARSFAATRQAPLDAPTREFLAAYLDGLRERVVDRLEAGTRKTFLELADPSSEAGLLNRRNLTLTVLDHVVTGVRPSPAACGATIRAS